MGFVKRLKRVEYYVRRVLVTFRVSWPPPSSGIRAACPPATVGRFLLLYSESDGAKSLDADAL